MATAVVDSILGRGIEKFNKGLFQAAVVEFNDALKIAPRHANAHLFRAMAHKMAGRRAQALRDINRAVELAPGSLNVRLGVAGLLRDLGRLDEALRECGFAVKIDGKSAAAYEMKSDLEGKLGLSAQALKSLQKALRLEPRRIQWRLRASGWLRDLGRNEEALRQCAMAIGIDGTLAAAYELKSDLEERLGRRQEALNSLRKAVGLEPGQFVWRLLLITRMRSLGLHTAALKECAEALRLDPSSSAAWELKSDLEASLGKQDEALRSIRKSIALDPRRGQCRIKAAEFLRRQGKDALALVECSAAVGSGEAAPAAYALMADIQSALGLKQEALRSIGKANRAAPRSFPLRVKAARMFKEEGRIGESNAECRMALNIAVDCSVPAKEVEQFSQVVLSWAHESLSAGRAKDAEMFFRTLIDSTGKSSWPLRLELADHLLQRGDWRGMRRILRESRSAGVNLRSLRERLVRFRPIFGMEPSA